MNIFLVFITLLFLHVLSTKADLSKQSQYSNILHDEHCIHIHRNVNTNVNEDVLSNLKKDDKLSPSYSQTLKNNNNVDILSNSYQNHDNDKDIMLLTSYTHELVIYSVRAFFIAPFFGELTTVSSYDAVYTVEIEAEIKDQNQSSTTITFSSVNSNLESFLSMIEIITII